MQNGRDIIVLRTMLKDVNVEYSVLVRTKSREDKPARMAELKTQRLALMSRISELRQSERMEAFPGAAGRGSLNVMWAHPALGAAAAAVAVGVQRYWALWAGGDERGRKAV